MFATIMVPVDLAHLEHLEKALSVAADLGRHYDATVTYVSVTTEAPSALAHNPQEFGHKLKAFAEEQAASRGFSKADARAYASHDPAVDLNWTLMKAIEDTGADLVVMASHKPGLPEYLFSSHGGHMASHAPVSVLVVR